ncbi:hypothetical protein HN51_050481 [Arachis hypogaea]|nr:uncharacterized protein DS421_17g582010 [Arachis hypogaea]
MVVELVNCKLLYLDSTKHSDHRESRVSQMKFVVRVFGFLKLWPFPDVDGDLYILYFLRCLCVGITYKSYNWCQAFFVENMLEDKRFWKKKDHYKPHPSTFDVTEPPIGQQAEQS